MQLNARKVALIANFAAISFILSYIKIFQRAEGGSVSLYLLPILILATKKDFKSTLLCSTIVALLQILIGGYAYNPIQVCLDYFFPLYIISSYALFCDKKIYVQVIAILGMFIGSLGSYVLSGVLFFETPIIFSITYNISYFLPTIVINFVVLYFVKSKLKFKF